MVTVYVQESLVPADWEFFVFYSYNVNDIASKDGTLQLESWVEPWADKDNELLQSGVF
jgi:hypothetical protein